MKHDGVPVSILYKVIRDIVTTKYWPYFDKAKKDRNT